MILPVFIVAIAAAAPPPANPCIVVEDESIRARDLAKAVPEFASLPAGQHLAYSPAHGVIRTLTPPELSRLAGRNGLRLLSAREICIERPMRRLDPELLVRAMRAELPEADIELSDFSRQPVPPGDIIFKRTLIDRRRNADGAVIWKGYIAYAANRRYPIWAKVRIAMRLTRIVATEDLPAGQPVEPRQLRRETYTGVRANGGSALEFEQIVGRTPKRPIAAGSVVSAKDLDEVWDIRRGDLVTVVAKAGRAQVSTTARAMEAARKGDKITVRNLRTGKTFSARAEIGGRVLVDADAGTSRAGAAERKEMQ